MHDLDDDLIAYMADTRGPLDGAELIEPDLCPTCNPAAKYLAPSIDRPRVWRREITHEAGCPTQARREAGRRGITAARQALEQARRADHQPGQLGLPFPSAPGAEAR